MKKAFTLAEVLITLTILGIIAAITVPSLISKQKESSNRVRLRKAMAAYDNAINKMSIISGFKTQQAFKDWAEDNSCENGRSFFKVVENTIGNGGCSFRTSDGLWWNISEIDRTLIAFKKDNLTTAKANDPNDKDAFVLVTSFDSSNETLRVDDLGYETNNDINNSKAQVQKLYEFMGANITKNSFEDIYYERFSAYKCTCSGENCCASKCPNEGCTAKIACKADAKINRNDSITFTPDSSCVAYQRYTADGSVVNDGNAIMINDNSVFIKVATERIYIIKNNDGTYTYYDDTPGNGGFINQIVFDSQGEPISYYNYNRGTCTKTDCSSKWNTNPFTVNARYGGYFGVSYGTGGTLDASSENGIRGSIIKLGLIK